MVESRATTLGRGRLSGTFGMATSEEDKPMNEKIPKVKGFICPNPSSKEGNYLFRFWCPFCRMFHQHGWTVSDMKKHSNNWHGSHRVSHCLEGSPFKQTGYFLKPYTEKEIKSE